MRDFTLPSLGADMDAGKLIEWLVKPGDQVHKGDVVAVVDTAKAAIEVEIWYDGVVEELLTVPGQSIAVGTVMARIQAIEEAPGSAGGPLEAAPSLTAVPVPGVTTTRPAAPTPAPRVEPGARRRVSPAARRLAGERGVDLAAVIGTGPLGSVTIADVEHAAAQVPPAPPATATPSGATAPAAVEVAGPEERQAQIRQAIAASMSRSKREIPHYYLSETIPLARATQWLTATNANRPITERILMAVLQLKSVARALEEFPQLNGFFVDGTFRPAPVAHIGVAISMRKGGLVAPALHDVAAKELPQLMQELSDLVARARAWKLRGSELSDPTITVTNLGDQGVEAVFGIITPPQVALVGFGRVAPRPWASDDHTLTVIPTVTASLAADHRVTDGHTGAMFLAALHDWLQRPEDL